MVGYGKIETFLKLLVFEKLLMVKLTLEGIAFIVPFLGKFTSNFGFII